jgi:osmotically-inducible protein OsmY
MLNMSFVRALLSVLLALLAIPVFAEEAKDDLIYDQIRQKLSTDREVGGNAIEVKVENGHVTLTGSVRTERQKSRAEKVTKNVKGVKKVENELVIAP